MSDKTQLNRSLSLLQMVLYGLGTTIGAGIYALISDLAGIAGYYAPISFLLAAFIASLTALSFAELSSRYPQAAGTAIFVKHGFNSTLFSTLTGLLVCFAGLVSAAALLNAFVGYLNQFIDWSAPVIITLMTLTLGVILIWGIQASANVAALFTFVEVGGLILIITVSHDSLLQFPNRWPELLPPLDFVHWQNIFAGSLLAFYAFIGFEDMVVVAEEVKNARKNMPIAIILTLFITTLLYLAVMTAAVLAVPPEQLMQTDAPLSYLFNIYTGLNPNIVNIIALMALVNGVLIQMLMASRVIYGLSTQHQLPSLFSYVSARTQTPITASLLVIGLVLIMAWLGNLSVLAQLTSLIMLIVFSLVNLALWRIKLTNNTPRQDIRYFPLWVPIIGFLVSFSFVVVTILKSLS